MHILSTCAPVKEVQVNHGAPLIHSKERGAGEPRHLARELKHVRTAGTGNMNSPQGAGHTDRCALNCCFASSDRLTDMRERVKLCFFVNVIREMSAFGRGGACIFACPVSVPQCWRLIEGVSQILRQNVLYTPRGGRLCINMFILYT